MNCSGKNQENEPARPQRWARLVSASRDTAQWEIEAFLQGNADFVLQNRERCLKLMEAGDGISAGKIDAMKMGMCFISVEKPAAFVLWRAGKSRWSGLAV